MRTFDDVPGRFVIRVDDSIFSERDGFLVRGGHTASLYVAAGDANALRITVRNGAAPGPVSLHVGGRHETIELGARQRFEITVPLTGDGLEGPVTIEAVNGCRPSEQNPESRDVRWLGSWVTLESLSRHSGVTWVQPMWIQRIGLIPLGAIRRSSGAVPCRADVLSECLGYPRDLIV